MTETSRVSPAGDGHPNISGRVRVSIRMHIPAGKRKEAHSIIASMIGRIRLEEGCLSCRLYQDVIDGKMLLYEEIWADENDFQKHLRSDEFRNVLLAVEMASKAPEIYFDRIARSAGIGTIKNERKGTAGPHDVSGLSV
jgi:quinol monooxygenase YgiN